MSTLKIDGKTVYGIAYKTFLALGVPEEDADIAAKVLQMADLRGVSSHGLNRVYLYLYPLRCGACPKASKLEVVQEGPGTLMLDACHSLGIVAAPKAMAMTIKKAKETGVCMTAVRNSGHFGMAGYYSNMAAQEGLIGLAISGTPPLMVPWGGKKPAQSNAPWSIAFPRGEGEDPILLDMATAEVAGGKVELAIRAEKKIPTTWGLDEEGRPTDDPNALWKSQAFLPFGGVKGYCLGFMWDLLSTVLPGGGMGPGGAMKDLQSPTNFGQFFMAVDPTRFRPWGEVKPDLERYVELITGTPLAADSKGILLPGEIEWRNYHKNLEEGVALDGKLAEELTALLKGAKLLPDDATVEDLLRLGQD